jgi:hypothetical protein
VNSPPKLTHLRIIVLVVPILLQRNVVVSLVFSVLHLLVSCFAGASYDGDDRRRRVFSSCVMATQACQGSHTHDRRTSQLLSNLRFLKK